MPKSNETKSIPSCGCGRNCQCQSTLRCRCHDLNALLVLALTDYGRMLRRQSGR